MKYFKGILLLILISAFSSASVLAQQETKPVGEDAPEGMVLIPAGEFLMGSPADEGGSEEHPQHKVYLDAFYIDKCEVTNAQFKKFVDATGYVTQAEKEGESYVWRGEGLPMVRGVNWRHPYDPDSGIEGIMDHPVVQVSWNDACAYARWAGKRLPTEAEWEKAARGTDGRRFPWGNTAPDGTRCNFADKKTDYSWSDPSVDDGYKYTAPVRTYEAGKSPYGVYDMAGNVWEWCSDWHDRDYYSKSPATNPTGPPTGTLHPSRGGAWSVNVNSLRVAHRFYGSVAGYRVNYLGFRCVQDVNQAQEKHTNNEGAL